MPCADTRTFSDRFLTGEPSIQSLIGCHQRILLQEPARRFPRSTHGLPLCVRVKLNRILEYADPKARPLGPGNED